MHRTDTLVVGGGQAGLALSRCLSDRGIDHVVIERGRIAERWRSERWDSLRLLTPNWQTRLPGFRYDGSDPDGFMTMADVVGFFDRYAGLLDVPVMEHTTVTRVAPVADAFLVDTDRGAWRARSVVVATGHCDVPTMPASTQRFAPDVYQTVPTRYRNPDSLPEGGVLVVGASASGVQLADELLRAGRAVTLAVGHHLRVARRYRGRDIMWWLDRTGILDEGADAVYDVEVSRDQPSFQLVGTPEHATLDLLALKRRGARVVGRLLAGDGHRVAFDDDLIVTTVAADLKWASLRQRLDRCAEWAELAGPPEPFVPTWPEFLEAPTELDLRAEGIRSVIWAVGFRRQYPWLQVPGVLDRRGELRHDGGVTTRPGLYALGLHFMRRRKSAFIDGVGQDAETLADHIGARLAEDSRLRTQGSGQGRGSGT